MRGFTETDNDGLHCTNTEQCAKRIRKAQRAALAGRCVDCLTEGADPKGARKLATKDDGSLQPGPRCVTHWRGRKRDVSQAAHDRRIDEHYELTPEQYRALYDAQGGKCFVCAKSTGKARRLAVDHDHKLALEHGHDPKKGCVECIRALLCKRCNTLVGWLDVDALCRAIVLLTNPPARKILTTPVVEPTAIPPTIADIDEVMDPALIEALDEPVADCSDFWSPDAATGSAGADDFWAAEADQVVDVADNFWFNSVES